MKTAVAELLLFLPCTALSFSKAKDTQPAHWLQALLLVPQAHSQAVLVLTPGCNDTQTVLGNRCPLFRAGRNHAVPKEY